jgi:hypothetical protein
MKNEAKAKPVEKKDDPHNNGGYPRCPRCGHNFYNDNPGPDGLCRWCYEEQQQEQH